MKFTFAPEATPLAGYTIKRAIDRGGFGEVYYALSDSGKEVALKLLQRNQQVELRGVSQCLNLKHPNLVTIFDIRTDTDGDHWVIMEYVAGKSLEHVLADNLAGLPLDDVEDWLAGMAAGTAFLHDRGIVHRDLKPANVFREGGVVKIGDVGLSKFITPSRRSAQTESVGTVYYMAPEVARGRYGSELDVYSLGIMLYEMLTGHVPFQGESTGEILMKHLTEPPDLTKIAAALRPVVGRALEKDPQRRTPGAARLLEEFRLARQGKPIAEEIPASHFVNVPQLERQQVRKPGASPAAKAATGGASTISHSPGLSGGNPLPPPQRPAPSPPLARQYGCATRNFGLRIGRELRKNPWLALVGLVVLFPVLPRLIAEARGLSPSLAELLILAGISYLTFTIIKSVATRGRTTASFGLPGAAPAVGAAYAQRPVAAPRQAPVAAAVSGASPAPARQAAVSYSPATVRAVPPGQRLSALAWSMTMAVVWSLPATLAATTLTGHIPVVSDEHGLLASPAGMGMFGLTTLLGAWAILVAAKLWEGSGASNRQRRLVQTALGAAVGACAFWLHEELLIDLPIRSTFPGLLDHVGNFALTTTAPVRQPSLAGYVLFFAALFGIRRWWWQADSFRPARFRLATVVFTGVVAYLLPAAFVFQQRWGALWGLAISLVVQLSAPWTAPRERPLAVRGLRS